MLSETSADIIVVGLGAMGAAALYQLARAGHSVLGIDRYHPPHAQGSSHGETRVTRLAVAEGDIYVPLVQRSQELWRELEQQSGARLFDQCGFLTIDSTDGDTHVHGVAGFYERTVEIARRSSILHEILTGAELQRRYPAFQVPADARAYYEPGSGLVYPERCIEVQLRIAQGFGGRIRAGEMVKEIRTRPGGVDLLTDTTVYHADRVVVAAGAWTPALIGARLSRMRLLRQVLHWFEPHDDAAYRSSNFPVFLWLHGARAEDSFYGFPLQPGSGIKLASEQYETETPDPELLDRTVGPGESAIFHSRHVEGRLRFLAALAHRSAPCVYTCSPDTGFVADFLPENERILVVSACSGHGFKHSAAMGEHLAALITGSRAPFPEFSISRPAIANESSASVRSRGPAGRMS